MWCIYRMITTFDVSKQHRELQERRGKSTGGFITPDLAIAPLAASSVVLTS
jgi:hypothetical protein